MGAGGTQTVVSADGTEIEWQRSGHGEPLVLIHGTSADRTRWAGVLPLLQPHFTVYAVDRRDREGLLRVFITEIVRAPLDQYRPCCSWVATVRVSSPRRSRN
jgi:hypothetical protein